MEIPIQHKKFTNQQLVIKTASFFGGPRLLLNGNTLKGKKGRYLVKNNEGHEVSVFLKSRIIDPVPKIKIENEEIELAPPLKWYEYFWASLPIILIFEGGIIGGAIGAGAAYLNIHIFRSSKNTIAKYIFSAFISIVAAIALLILAIIFHSFIQGTPTN